MGRNPPKPKPSRQAQNRTEQIPKQTEIETNRKKQKKESKDSSQLSRISLIHLNGPLQGLKPQLQLQLR